MEAELPEDGSADSARVASAEQDGVHADPQSATNRGPAIRAAVADAAPLT